MGYVSLNKFGEQLCGDHVEIVDGEDGSLVVVLADGLECLPAGLELLSPQEALVTLREGKFHQVKRMLAACGKPVTYLKRLSMGPLRLDEALAPGAFRPLSDGEIHTLLDICGLNPST